MSTPADALARRAVACKGWRWIGIVAAIYCAVFAGVMVGAI